MNSRTKSIDELYEGQPVWFYHESSSVNKGVIKGFTDNEVLIEAVDNQIHYVYRVDTKNIFLSEREQRIFAKKMYRKSIEFIKADIYNMDSLITFCSNHVNDEKYKKAIEERYYDFKNDNNERLELLLEYENTGITPDEVRELKRLICYLRFTSVHEFVEYLKENEHG